MLIRIKTAVRFHHSLLLVFLILQSNLKCGVWAHWINLHVWHDDLFAPEPLASTSIQAGAVTSDNGTIVSPPGGDFNDLPNCQELDGLTDAQIKLCLLFFDHMRPVIQGAKLGLSECQWQFRYHHWNCSASAVIQSRVVRENKHVGKGSFQGEIKSSELYDVGSNGAESPIFQPSSGHSKKQKQQQKMTSVLTHTGGKRLMRPAAALQDAPQTSHSLPRSLSSNHYIVTKEKTNWNSVLTRGSKEVAFAHAVWAAAVTDSVARACRDGSLTSCGCGKTPRPGDLRGEWRWGGCSDNLQYGYKFAQSFVDIREQENTTPLDKKAKARSLVNLHNNEAGRRAVLKKTKIACKCHGVSGSCALVTCWHQIPSFREIGDYLKDRYASATQVKLNKRGRLQVKRSGVRVPSVYDLVYVEQSPNYCVQNETIGIFGTSGRVCNRTSSGPGSCKSLCCNRGFKTNVVKSQNRCNCKFIWCCQVVCEECRSVQKFDVCN